MTSDSKGRLIVMWDGMVGCWRQVRSHLVVAPGARRSPELGLAVWNDLTYAAPRVRHVAVMSRYQVNMKVTDAPAGGRSFVDADRVPVRSILVCELLLGLRQEF